MTTSKPTKMSSLSSKTNFPTLCNWLEGQQFVHSALRFATKMMIKAPTSPRKLRRTTLWNISVRKLAGSADWVRMTCWKMNWTCVTEYQYKGTFGIFAGSSQICHFYASPEKHARNNQNVANCPQCVRPDHSHITISPYSVSKWLTFDGIFSYHFIAKPLRRKPFRSGGRVMSEYF